jgi:hypothetical protein
MKRKEDDLKIDSLEKIALQKNKQNNKSSCVKNEEKHTQFEMTHRRNKNNTLHPVK